MIRKTKTREKNMQTCSTEDWSQVLELEVSLFAYVM